MNTLIFVLVSIQPVPFLDIPLRTASSYIPDTTQLMFRPVPRTDTLVSRVSLDSITSYITRLQNFQTRYSFADSNVSASQWLYNKFIQFSLDSIAFDSFPHPENPSSWQRNVVGVKFGDMEPNRVIIIGGHFDSVVYGSGTNPYIWAPGADDNGSGTTGTIEIARILKSVSTDKTIYFVPFAAEEQGLYGSDHFAENAQNQGMNIVFMINMDMIGYEPNNIWNVVVESNNSSRAYVDLTGEMALLYTTSLVPELYYSTGAYSDHWSFLIRGYKAIFASEGDFNWNGWHTNYDIVDSLNLPYMREVIQMCFASLLQVSEMPDIPLNLTAQNLGDGSSVILSWSQVPQVDVKGYFVYSRQSSPIYTDTTFVSGTDTILSGFQTGIPVYFAVSAVDTFGYESFISQEVSVIPELSIAESDIDQIKHFFSSIPTFFSKRKNTTFFIPENLTLDISIYDVSGKKVFKRNKENFSKRMYTMNIPVNRFKTGVYFLEIKIDGVKHRKKIIIF